MIILYLIVTTQGEETPFFSTNQQRINIVSNLKLLITNTHKNHQSHYHPETQTDTAQNIPHSLPIQPHFFQTGYSSTSYKFFN